MNNADTVPLIQAKRNSVIRADSGATGRRGAVLRQPVARGAGAGS